MGFMGSDAAIINTILYLYGININTFLDLQHWG